MHSQGCVPDRSIKLGRIMETCTLAGNETVYYSSLRCAEKEENLASSNSVVLGPNGLVPTVKELLPGWRWATQTLNMTPQLNFSSGNEQRWTQTRCTWSRDTLDRIFLTHRDAGSK